MAGGTAAEPEPIKIVRYKVAQQRFLQLDEQVKKFPLVEQVKKKQIEELNRRIAVREALPLYSSTPTTSAATPVTMSRLRPSKVICTGARLWR